MREPLHVSDLKLERFALGELPAAEMEKIQAELEADPALSARLRTLQESNTSILRETPPAEFARRLQASMRRRAVEESLREDSGENTQRGFFVTYKPLWGSAAILALVALIAVPVTVFQTRQPLSLSDGEMGTEGEGVETPSAASPEHPVVAEGQAENFPSIPAEPQAPTTAEAPEAPAQLAAAPDDGIRLKGLEPHLAIFRKTQHGAEPLRPGEKARAGELLRIGYQAAGYPYGAILSVDGNGNVTRHWPTRGESAGKLESGDALLPSSFELDAAPHFERFYLVVSKKAFQLDPLLKALRVNESLPAPGALKGAQEIQVVGFEVLKEAGI